jgi:hypothetical protein
LLERPKRSATTVAKGYTVDEPTTDTLSRPAAWTVLRLRVVAQTAINPVKSFFT